MKRIHPVALCLLLVSACALASCTCRFRAQCPAPCGQGCVTHVVLVELADDADLAAMRSDSNEKLPKIAGVCGYQCGAPLDIGRTNVTGDYDLGILVQFPTVEAYKAYLDDPSHKELVAKWRPKWKSSRIFDFSSNN